MSKRESHTRSGDHYDEIADRLDELGKLHAELAKLLDLAPVQKHAEGDKALAEAEEKSAQTCLRIATSIRRRLFEGDDGQ